MRIRKVGTLQDARRELWRAIWCARNVLLTSSDKPDISLRAVHAMQQACSAYAKLIEAGEFEERLRRVESQYSEGG